MAAIRRISRTFLVVAAAAGATLVPVTAQAAPPNPDLNLVNLSAQRDRVTPSFRAAVLSCGPTGGTHPNAEGACASLKRADGNFGSLRSENATSMCPLIYQPVTVTAKGTWHNKPVEFTKTYSNDCTLKAQTGEVFDF